MWCGGVYSNYLHKTSTSASKNGHYGISISWKYFWDIWLKIASRKVVWHAVWKWPNRAPDRDEDNFVIILFISRGKIYKNISARHFWWGVKAYVSIEKTRKIILYVTPSYLEHWTLLLPLTLRSYWPLRHHWQTCVEQDVWPTFYCRTFGIHLYLLYIWRQSSVKKKKKKKSVIWSKSDMKFYTEVTNKSSWNWTKDAKRVDWTVCSFWVSVLSVLLICLSQYRSPKSSEG